jgi:hypothetical protein
LAEEGEEVTTAEHNIEYDHLISERLGMILEHGNFKPNDPANTGQRPATEADKDQAREEASEMMDAIERAEGK